MFFCWFRALSIRAKSRMCTGREIFLFQFLKNIVNYRTYFFFQYVLDTFFRKRKTLELTLIPKPLREVMNVCIRAESAHRFVYCQLFFIVYLLVANYFTTCLFYSCFQRSKQPFCGIIFPLQFLIALYTKGFLHGTLYEKPVVKHHHGNVQH